MRDELDHLLDRSSPRLAESNRGHALGRALAAEITTTPMRSSCRRTLTVFGASLIGALTIGTGAAFAARLVMEWWQWTPEEDLILTTEPFEHDGETITCDIAMSVQTDGQTADETSAERLLNARIFLGTVELDNYDDAARALLESGFEAFLAESTNYGSALQQAILEDFRDRDLLGRGVPGVARPGVEGARSIRRR